MSNTFISTDLVAREALLLLRNNLVASMLFDRSYEGSFTGDEKVGDTVRIRRRDEGAVQEFSTTITKDPIVETNVNLRLEKHFDASFEVTTKQLTLDIQDFSSQILAPRVIRLAEAVDAYCLTKLHHLPNVAMVGSYTGTSADIPAALPNSIASLANARRTLNELRVPLTGRVQIASPEYEATLLGVGDFMKADSRGDQGAALNSANLGRIMGVDTYMAQLVASGTFTPGTFTSGAINGARTPGMTTLVMDGLVGATDTLKEGDMLRIAGYGNVVVAADATGSGSAITVTIVEPLMTDVADNAVVTRFGDSANTYQRHGAMFHPRAFAFASVPLVIPPEAEGTVISFDGLSIRAIRDYDISSKKSIMSLDVLVGAAMVDGRLGAQIVRNV